MLIYLPSSKNYVYTACSQHTDFTASGLIFRNQLPLSPAAVIFFKLYSLWTSLTVKNTFAAWASTMSKAHYFKFPSSNTGAGGRGIKTTFILSPNLKKSKLIRVMEFQSCTKSYWRRSFSFQHIYCWEPFNSFLLRNSWIWKLAES